MNGQRVGYVRVSSIEQNAQRQLDGVALDRVFTDQASGRNSKRPQLSLLLGFVRAGDTVLSTAWTGSRATWTTCATSFSRSPAAACELSS
jgi:hypothetical protein